MMVVPSNVERAWEYGLNARKENTVCVFTLQCVGLLRETARQLGVLTSNGKKQGVRHLESHKRFPPLRSLMVL